MAGVSWWEFLLTSVVMHGSADELPSAVRSSLLPGPQDAPFLRVPGLRNGRTNSAIGITEFWRVKRKSGLFLLRAVGMQFIAGAMKRARKNALQRPIRRVRGVW